MTNVVIIVIIPLIRTQLCLYPRDKIDIKILVYSYTLIRLYTQIKLYTIYNYISDIIISDIQ